MTTYYTPVSRGASLSTVAEYKTNPPYTGSGTNISMSSVLGNTRWYRQVSISSPISGTIWNVATTNTSSNIRFPANNTNTSVYNSPFAYFDLFATGVFETTVENNYGGWQYGDSIDAYSRYSRDLGWGYGTFNWKGYSSSGKYYFLRQFYVNNTRSQLALRFNVYNTSGTITTASGNELQYINIRKDYPSSTSTALTITPSFAGNFNTDLGDRTAVWLGSVPNAASTNWGLGYTALICEFSS